MGYLKMYSQIEAHLTKIPVKPLRTNNIRNTLINLIKTYEEDIYRIRLLSYRWEDIKINDKKFLDFLKKLAISRGVTITLITGENPINRKKLRKVKKAFRELIKVGVSVFYNKKAHLKLAIIESERKNFIIMMSSNITHGGLYYHYEIGILMIPNTQIYNYIIDYVNEIISDSKAIDIGELR